MTQVNIKKPGKTSGYSGDIVCKYCGKVFQKGEILPATEAGDAKLSATKYTYNGKTHQPTVTVDDMTLNKDYTVKWSGNGKNVGTYKATVHFKEANVDTELSFEVVPAGAKIKKARRGKRYIKARWYRQSKKMSTSRITGYQVQYSKSSSFKDAKTVTVKGYKKTSKKIKKLKRKTKYYVHVRTYKTVSGKNYYSNWSGTKSVKTR